MGHACCVSACITITRRALLFFETLDAAAAACRSCCWHARFHYLVNSGLLGFRNRSLLKRELRDNNQSDKITCFYYASLSTSRFQSLVGIIPFFEKPKSRASDSSQYTMQDIVLEKMNANSSYLKKKKQNKKQKTKSYSNSRRVGSTRKGGACFVDNISVRYMSVAFMTIFKKWIFITFFFKIFLSQFVQLLTVKWTWTVN